MTADELSYSAPMFSGRVAVVGVGGPVAAAFVRIGTETVGADRLVEVDTVAHSTPVTEFRHAVGADDVARAVADCEGVVYFGVDAPTGPDAATRAGAAPGGPDVVDAIVAAAASRSTPLRLVVVSSTRVYGAWQNNPVPLTEAAPVRPNEDAPDVARLAEIERRLGDVDASLVHVSVLRSATVLGPGVGAESCAELLGSGRVGVVGGRPVRQFAHVDDVAAAAWHCIEFDLTGAFNVASQGWVTADAIDAMARRRPPAVELRPDEYRRWLDLSRPGAAGAGGAEVAHDMYPCVGATTRLAGTGFRPVHTNGEVLRFGLDAAEHWHKQVRRSRRALSTPVVVGAAVLGALWLSRRRQ